MQLQDLSRADLAKMGPAPFAVYASGGAWQMAQHLELLNEYLLKLAAREIMRLLITMPPQHGKSELSSAHTPPWWLGTFPDEKIILASYEENFAAGWGQRARDIFQQVGPELWNLEVDPTNRAADDWGIRDATTGKQMRGSMRTAGMKGAITGKPADLIIIDDPHKNKDEADSDVLQEKIWNTYLSALYTRLGPRGVVMLIQTRWHDLDLAGRVLKLEEEIAIEGEEDGDDETWTVLNLPALAEPNDPLGRLEGEALFPERYDTPKLKKRKRRLGTKLFVALYQGKPTPDEGNIIQREWMQERYRKAPMGDMQRIIQTVDSAFKEGVKNDYSVIATWGITESDCYLLDVWRDKVTFPDLKTAIKDNFFKWVPAGVSATFVEDAASGQSVIQELQRDTAIPVLPVSPVGSQQSRVEAISGIFEARNVKLPYGKPWLSDWIEEHARYPDGAHDDQVLTTAYALAELVYGGAAIMEMV